MSLGSMCSVTANARDQDEFTDLFGNAWQWCLDYFSPLDNFDVHKLYEGWFKCAVVLRSFGLLNVRPVCVLS